MVEDSTVEQRMVDLAQVVDKSLLQPTDALREAQSRCKARAVLRAIAERATEPLTRGEDRPFCFS